MPYKRIQDLPAAVRELLPKQGQKIYQQAYNNAWDQYADRKDREAIAHRVAWSAVKKQYEKRRNRWVKS